MISYYKYLILTGATIIVLLYLPGLSLPLFAKTAFSEMYALAAQFDYIFDFDTWFIIVGLVFYTEIGILNRW
jgi:hypothetical protein